jgi:hypothetical protein
VAKPKSAGALFSTIWNECKGLGKSIVSARTPRAKVNVFVNFTMRTIGNLAVAGAIGIKNALTSEKKSKERKKEVQKRQQVQLKPVESKKSDTGKKISTPEIERPPEPKPPAPDPYQVAYNQAKLDGLKSLAKYRFQHTGLKDFGIETKEPSPFWEPKPSEPYEVIKCKNACCEGTGEFVFSNSHRQNYIEHGNAMPKNCYPCRIWKFEISNQPYIKNPCSKCGEEVIVTSKVWIGYHIYIGKPTAEKFCTNCQYTEKEEFFSKKKVDKEYQKYGYFAPMVEELEKNYSKSVKKKILSEKEQKEQARRIAFKEWIMDKLKAKTYNISMTDLVDVYDLSPDTRTDHPYHTESDWFMTNGILGVHTAYAHLKRHVLGDIEDNTSADFSDFSTTADFLKAKHPLVCELDLEKFMDFPQLNGAIMRCDFTDNSMYLVKDSHIITAYKKVEPNKFVAYLYSKYCGNRSNDFVK